ncbi:NADP-dependent phosphogluconate dehydrogenase [Salegentibacter sp. F188]|uniref:6-phosphogluconate dehydrogenase, decarboxylating n=1 Tax=Autumnicola patrickiae TaxID=3075591 RepID=A0ABU3E2B9_9FLAO|nr:NADP-dependent phosphogluconate dehydrogenase [Salegentibacter sp. F188]MDT0690123.1 NADP-dependent phosphogluconate dehydrogenase [Salegentibacter sp. F188]
MQVYIVMGVSGVGKTTIGELLSEKINVPFYDADDFHPPENRKKMKEGIPLQDSDREEWLETLSNKISEWEKEDGAVLACSALKEKYRKHLQSIPKEEITWIFLHSEYETILDRMSSREDHYFKPELLKSQFETLEIPNYGFHVNVDASKEEVLDEIIWKLNKKEDAHMGLVGLGVMGKSLALNFASKGIDITVFNRHVEELEVDIAKKFAEENKLVYEFPWFDNLEKFVKSLERPRNIILMVNAGPAVDMVIESLLPFLDKDDLIIDGGNSHYKETVRREGLLKEKGIFFMGAGISGGEEGALKGPSIMPGGPKEAYDRAGKILERIAAKDRNGNPCCTHVGPDGAGHFVKMLHNGIEYGEMQLIAETYHFLRFGTNAAPQEIADLFEEWNKDMKSFLLEISVEILRKKENDGFIIDQILDAAKQKGTGGWSTNAALELGVPLDTITAAVLARNISGKKQDRVSAMKAYNRENKRTADLKEISDDLFKAYKAGSIINHAIGFDLLLEASKSYDWNLNLSEIARIWTNGCIIRSSFMEDLIDILKDKPSENVLMHSEIISLIKNSESALTGIVGQALKAGYPMPVLSSAANYLLSFTSGQSSANMIQAQRDFFGAHTYERTDKPRGEFFHTQWLDN